MAGHEIEVTRREALIGVAHVWTARLPADLASGAYRVEVEAGNEYGTIVARRLATIEPTGYAALAKFPVLRFYGHEGRIARRENGLNYTPC